MRGQSAEPLCPSGHENTENGRIQRGTPEAPCGRHSGPARRRPGGACRKPPSSVLGKSSHLQQVSAHTGRVPGIERTQMVTLLNMRSEVTGSKTPGARNGLQKSRVGRGRRRGLGLEKTSRKNAYSSCFVGGGRKQARQGYLPRGGLESTATVLFCAGGGGGGSRGSSWIC